MDEPAAVDPAVLQDVAREVCHLMGRAFHRGLADLDLGRTTWGVVREIPLDAREEAAKSRSQRDQDLRTDT